MSSIIVALHVLARGPHETTGSSHTFCGPLPVDLVCERASEIGRRDLGW